MALGLAEMAQRRNSAKESCLANYRTPPLPLGPEVVDGFVCAFPSVFLKTAQVFSYVGFGTDRRPHYLTQTLLRRGTDPRTKDRVKVTPR